MQSRRYCFFYAYHNQLVLFLNYINFPILSSNFWQNYFCLIHAFYRKLHADTLCTTLEKFLFGQKEYVGLKMYTLSNPLQLMHHFGSLKSHQQEEGNWDTIFKDSAIYSRCVKCCIFSLLFPVSLVWSSWLCGLETPGQLCFVSWGCRGRSSSITVKLTVNRFCMNANKALKLGAKTAEEGRWGEKILVYLSRWHYHNVSSFVIYFY